MNSRPRPARSAAAPRPGAQAETQRPPAVDPEATPEVHSAGPVSGSSPWTFFSNHAHVLICIAADPETRMRDLAARVGITERAVQRIVTDLEDAGYIARQKAGRRNRYSVAASRPLRHPIERHCATDALLDLVLGPGRR